MPDVTFGEIPFTYEEINIAAGLHKPGTQKYVSSVSQDGEIEYVQSGSTNWTETITGKANHLNISQELYEEMGNASYSCPDVSFWIEIDASPLQMGISKVRGWVHGMMFSLMT